MHHRRNERDPWRGKERYGTTDTYIMGPVLVPPFPTYVGEIRHRKARYMRHAAENHLHVKKVGKPTSLVR